MMNPLDFVFGKKALKEAAGTGAPVTPKVETPAGIDVAGEAAKLAKKKKAQAAADAAEDALKTRKRPGGVAARIGSQLMEQ